MFGRRSLSSALAVALMLSVGCSHTSAGKKHRYLESGDRYAKKGEFRSAAIEYLNAIRLDARFQQAHYGLAQVALKMGDRDTAFYEFLQTTELDPANLDAQIQVGNLYLARGNRNEARKRAELVLARTPESLGGHLLMAEYYGSVADWHNRDLEIEKCLSMAPNKPEPYLVQASAQTADRKYADAVASYNQALSLEKDNLDALLGLSRVYELQRNYPQAERMLEQAVKIDQRDPASRMSLILLELTMHNPQKAEQVAREGKAAGPDNQLAYSMLGNFYIWTGDVPRATAEYRAIVKQHPTDSQAQRALVQLLIYQNQLDEAEKLNNAQLAVTGVYPDTLIESAEIKLRRHQPEAAIEALKTALQVDDKNYLGHYYYGLALEMIGEHEGSQREWQRAAELDRSRPEPELALAEVAAESGKTDLYSKTVTRLMQLEPQSPRAYVVKASSEFARKDFAAGEADLKKAIAAAPQDPVGYLAMADYRASRGEWPAAADMAEKVLALDPNMSKALAVIVKSLVVRHETPQAIERVNAAIAKQPGNSNFYLVLAELKYNQNDLAGAEAAAQKAVDLAANNALAWQLLGTAQARRGAIDATIQTYQKWAAAIPTDATPEVILGQITQGRDDWKGAENHYQTALQRDRNNAIAANNLAFLMVEHDQDALQAISYAMRARDARPDSAVTLDTLGWAYFHNKQYKLAVDLLRQAEEKDSKNPNIHYHLGLAYDKLKDHDNARQQLTRVLALQPAYPRADDIRSILRER